MLGEVAKRHHFLVPRVEFVDSFEPQGENATGGITFQIAGRGSPVSYLQAMACAIAMSTKPYSVLGCFVLLA